MDYAILDDGRTHVLPDGAACTSLDGAVGTGGSDGLRLEAGALKETLGWELKAEGLCKDEICVPVRDRAALVNDDGVDLVAFADLLGRPVVVDNAAGVAALGRGVDSQLASMTSLQAPDFDLPDLAGERHTLSAHRGKKVLLIAYASW